ncbi:hypothetical protein IQ255_10950 [Pleurocapsales cyanobacterium LEGE 10410]|nr:hypothetical protein [Pleurocapsales cyanobacterium LEGE 10410]
MRRSCLAIDLGDSFQLIFFTLPFLPYLRDRLCNLSRQFIPPADWEFVTRDCEASRRHRLGQIINSTWWGYEDGKIDIGFYIENFLKRCKVEQ